MTRKACIIGESLSQKFAGPILVASNLAMPSELDYNVLLPKNPRSLNAGNTDPIVISEDDNFVFAGKLETYNDSSNNVLVVIDKQSKTVTLYPVAMTQISRILKSSLNRLNNESQPQLAPDAAQNRRKELGAAFGTKKRQREIERAEQNAFNSFDDSSLSHTINQSQLDSLPEAPVQYSIIPTPNLETTNLNKVYTLESIFPDVQISDMISQDLVELGDWSSINNNTVLKHSHYAKQRATRIAKQDATQSEKKLEILYLIAVMTAFAKSYKNPSKTKPTFDKFVNSSLVQFLMKHFTETSGAFETELSKAVMTQRYRDKLFCHIFALCLIVDKYEVNIEEIIADLGITGPHASNLFKALGCQVENRVSSLTQQTARYAILSIPLKFPKTIQRRARR